MLIPNFHPHSLAMRRKFRSVHTLDGGDAIVERAGLGKVLCYEKNCASLLLQQLLDILVSLFFGRKRFHVLLYMPFHFPELESVDVGELEVHKIIV